MSINQWPSIFKRDEFSFKTLKKQLPPTEIEALKTTYKTVWNEWKQANLLVASKLDIPQPKIESWTNGWKLRDHFWTAYRIGNVNPCLAVLVNRKQLQVYLMYQNYRSEVRKGTKEAYQAAVNQALVPWSQTVNTQHYAAWSSTDDELAPHPSLFTYLASPTPTDTLIIGRLWYFPLEANFDYLSTIVTTLNELLPLYKAVID